MKYKHFIPPFYEHNPAALEQGELTDINEIFNTTFVSMYYLQKDTQPIIGFSFQENDGGPTALAPIPPTHLVNVDMDGGRSYVIGHLWMTKDEAKWNAEFLAKKFLINEVYTGNEPMFQPNTKTVDQDGN